MILFGSRTTDEVRVTTYTINGLVSQSLNVANNTSATCTFTGIRPIGGAIKIGVTAGTGSRYGNLDVIELVAHPAAGASTWAQAGAQPLIVDGIATTADAPASGGKSAGCGLGSGIALLAGLALLLRGRKR